MPEKDFIIRTEYDIYSRALILDDLGELSTLLVDSLLNHGCIVYYFGVENKETFYYLSDKKNFIYLSGLEELSLITALDYCFCFPKINTRFLEEINLLSKKIRFKTLICCEEDFSNSLELNSLLKNEQLNVRILVYQNVFGSRIKSGILSSIIFQGITSQQVYLPNSSSEEINYISAGKLISEILKVTFSLDFKGKISFVTSGTINISSLVNKIQTYFPQTVFHLKESGVGEEFLSKKENTLKTTVLEDDLDEEIEKTIEWFKRLKKQPETKQLDIEVKIEIPKEKERETVLINKESIIEKQEIIIDKKDEEVKAEPEVNMVGDLDFIFAANQKILENNEKQLHKKRKTKKFLLGTVIFTLLTLIFFIVPVSGIIIFGFSAINLTSDSIIEVNRGNPKKAIDNTITSEKFLNLSKSIVSLSGPFYSLIGIEEDLEKVNNSLEVTQRYNRSQKLVYQAVDNLSKYFSSWLNGQEVKWPEETGIIKANFSEAYQETTLAQLSMKGSEQGFKFLNKEDFYKKTETVLPVNRENFLKLKNLLGIFPEAFGVGGRKTYLLLIQNNLELRPTGGFIGAYGIISLENGKLVNFEISDVYKADNLLKGKVEPPVKLKEYLGEETWYLRDSNWEIDFPTSAKRAEWFLDKEIQLIPDGVIAINLTTLQEIIKVTGSINLTDSKEEINKDNIFSKSLSSLESSDQEKGDTGFTGELVGSIFEKVKKSQSNELIELGKVILSLLDKKEILIYFNDPNLQSTVSELGWDGGVKTYRPKIEGRAITSDYLYINESNVGINKVNLYVSRNVNHKISLQEDGKLKEKITLSYQNESSSESWPLGTYKNYLRVMLPRFVKIENVLLRSSKNGNSWQAIDEKQLTLSEEYEKTVLGVLVEIPAKSVVEMEINYELNEGFELNQKVNSYLLYVQKQSGEFSSVYNLTFSYPDGFTPLRVLPKAKASTGLLVVQEILDKDKIIQIDIAR